MARAAEASRGRRQGRGLTPKPPSYYLRSRLVHLQDGREVYALQGTTEYVEGVAVEMAGNTTNPVVQAAGLKILAKIRRGAWHEIEYAFVVSRWVRRGDRVIGVSDAMQVTQVTLR